MVQPNFSSSLLDPIAINKDTFKYVVKSLRKYPNIANPNPRHMYIELYNAGEKYVAIQVNLENITGKINRFDRDSETRTVISVVLRAI